jgi:hypothetical protein
MSTPPASRQALNKNARKEETMTDDQTGSSTIQLILAWGFVGIPLAWGVLETLQNAMKLFQ